MTEEAPSSLEAFLKGSSRSAAPENASPPRTVSPVSAPNYPVPAPRQPLGSFLASLKGGEAAVPAGSGRQVDPEASVPEESVGAAALPRPEANSASDVPPPAFSEPSSPADFEEALPDPEPVAATAPAPQAEAASREPPRVGFRRFWDARNAVASTVLAQAEEPLAPGASAQSLAEFDTALATEAARKAVEAWQAGGRFVLMLPVHQTTLLRHRLRIPYVDAWLAQPDALRRITRFCVTGLDETVSRAELTDMGGMLNRLGRPPVLAPPLKSTHITRAGGIGIFGVLYDRAAASESERAWFDERSAAIARRGSALGLKLLLGGIFDAGAARAAIANGVEFLELRGPSDLEQVAEPLTLDVYLNKIAEIS